MENTDHALLERAKRIERIADTDVLHRVGAARRKGGDANDQTPL